MTEQHTDQDPTTDTSPDGRPVGFTNLGDVLTRWAAEDPDAPALITSGRVLSVHDLTTLAATQAESLSRRTAPRARIGVHAPNSAEFVALLYAVPSIGRTLVPLNTRLHDTELSDQLRRARAELLIGDKIDGFAGSTITLDDLTDTSTGTRGDDTGRAPMANDSDHTAWIIFTSGSTGRPKGALLTHASIAAAVTATAAARPLADDEVYLYPFPLFHVAAYNIIHANARRRPVVLPERFDAADIIGLCHAHSVTAMSLAATMLSMMLDALDADNELAVPPTLRTIAYGAAPMPETLLRRAHHRLGCDFAQGYGSTELSGNAVFLGPEAHRRGLEGETRLLRAAGYGAPGVRVAIIDDDGHDVAPGQPGEIVICADQVCAGYLDDPVATAKTIRGGCLHTGDVGTMGADGLLTIVDRAKDIVITGGENVASREVEDVLRTHADVADVAIVATPDPRWGEAVTAVIVPVKGADAPTQGPSRVPVLAPIAFVESLRVHVTDRLAGFKKPRRIFVVDELPHNASGKVDKPALRAALAEHDSPKAETGP